MTYDLTNEAAHGHHYAAHHNTFAMTMNELRAACPYLHTSPSALAWHLGRFLQTEGEESPTVGAPADPKRRVVRSGRGDSLTLRGYKDISLGRFDTRDQIIYRRIA